MIDPATCVAWVRARRKGWHAVIEGSEQTCRQALLAWPPAGEANVDKLVLPHGERPWRLHAGVVADR